MELTKNQKIVGISLGGVVAYLLYRKKAKLQSHRADGPMGPVQVVVPVPTNAGTGAIANVLGNILPTAHTDLVGKALGQTPLVIQNGRMAPTRISTIADIQHALNFLKICGTTPLKDSGVLDAPTAACLKAFQSISQIPVTGLDDPTTKFTLESAITKAAISLAAPAILANPAVTSAPAVNPTIATERDLQRGLNVLGASPKLKEDGKIGPVTTAAIKAFQVIHGLTADGLAGPQTKAAIATAMTTPAPAVSPVDVAAHGDFGYVAPPPPPIPHPSMPGFMGAGGGGYMPVIPPQREGWRHRPAPPTPQGFLGGIQQQLQGIPGVPNPPITGLNSWERWQQVHPGTPRSDYDNWWAQYGHAGATINGDFGDFGFHSSPGAHVTLGPRGMRGRAFALGVPYDEEVALVETVDDDGNPVQFNGDEIREMEDRAVHNAHHAANDAIMRGDRRFEHAEIGPGTPPLVGEHRREESHPGVHRGIFDRFRGFFGFGQRGPRPSLDTNPYIPPPATPPVVNWDPFAVDTAPAAERWSPDDLRRREELHGRGYRPAPPIEPGRPAPPVFDQATPPAPPPLRR